MLFWDDALRTASNDCHLSLEPEVHDEDEGYD